MGEQGQKQRRTPLQRLRFAGGCLLALLIAAGVIALLIKVPILWPAGFALFLMLGVQIKLEETLKESHAAMIAIAVVAIATAAAVIAKAEIEICFIVFCSVAAVLLYSRSKFPADGVAASLVRGYSGVAVALAIVSLLLYLISTHIENVPPNSILRWGERLSVVERAMQKIEKASTILLLTLIALYFLTTQWRRNSEWFGGAWRWSKLSRTWLEKVSLVLACLSGFSFVGGGTGNSPLVELDKARASALADYRDIVWRVQIELQSETAFKVAQDIYQQAPPAAKQDFLLESLLARRTTPVQYYASGFHGASTDSLLGMQDTPYSALDTEVRNQSAQESEGEAGEIPAPTVTATLIQLDAVKSEITTVEERKADHEPAWLQGYGSDVLAEIVGLVISADRIPFLNRVGDIAPLAGKVLDATFDSIDDSATGKIRRAAQTVVDDRLAGRLSSLSSGISAAVLAMEYQVVPPDVMRAEWAHAEDALQACKVRSDSAQKRFDDDLVSRLKEEADLAAEQMTKYDKLEGKGAADQSSVSYKDTPQERNLETLRNLNSIGLEYEGKISDFVNAHPGDSRLNSILGDELGKYKARGQQRESARVAAAQAQAREQEREREMEREASPAERGVP